MKIKFVLAFVLMAGIAGATEPTYVNHEEVKGNSAEMAKVAPHIIIDGEKLDWDPAQKSYVYHTVPTREPWKGEKQRVMWIQWEENGKPVRQLFDQPDRIDNDGRQYQRQKDGNWLANGKTFHPGEEKYQWDPDVLEIDQIAIEWDPKIKSYYEYKTNQLVRLKWKEVKGGNGAKTRVLLRTERASKLNPRPGDLFFSPDAPHK